MFIANVFEFPCFVVDDLLDELNGDAIKLLLVIVRKTRGFNDNLEFVSVDLLSEISGLPSQLVLAALAELEKIDQVEEVQSASGLRGFRLSEAVYGDFTI
jgi:RIO-like serine/threonine protein kinase